MKAILWLLEVVSILLIPIALSAPHHGMQVAVPASMAILSGASLVMLKLGFRKYIPELVIWTVMTLACFSVATSGSVRSAATIMFVGAVAAAGIFLTARALVASGLFAVMALGLLTWAEVQGHLANNMLAVNIRVWIIESTGILVVGFMVYFSRVRAQRASDQQILELHKRLTMEVERDRSLSRFTRIFRNSPSPMLVQSAITLNILDVNPAMERCFCYESGQILGRSDAQLWAHHESRKRFHQLMVNENRVDNFKTVGRRSDGSEFPVLVSSERDTELDDQLIITTVTDASHHSHTIEHLRASPEPSTSLRSPTSLPACPTA